MGGGRKERERKRENKEIKERKKARESERERSEGLLWLRQISAVAKSSIKLLIGTHPLP